MIHYVFVLSAMLIRCVPCNSCRLLPGPWKAQSHWFWRTVGWPTGRYELPNLCAQSSSPPDTSFPSTPGASGWQCSPQLQYLCQKLEDDEEYVFFSFRNVVFLIQIKGVRTVFLVKYWTLSLEASRNPPNQRGKKSFFGSTVHNTSRLYNLWSGVISRHHYI